MLAKLLFVAAIVALSEGAPDPRRGYGFSRFIPGAESLGNSTVPSSTELPFSTDELPSSTTEFPSFFTDELPSSAAKFPSLFTDEFPVFPIDGLRSSGTELPSFPTDGPTIPDLSATPSPSASGYPAFRAPESTYPALPRPSSRAARFLEAKRLHSNSPQEILVANSWSSPVLELKFLEPAVLRQDGSEEAVVERRFPDAEAVVRLQQRFDGESSFELSEDGIAVNETNADSKPDYKYEYVVNSPGNNVLKMAAEVREGKVLAGFYRFLQPDGCVRTVRYVQSESGMLVQEISYDGAGCEERYNPPPPTAPTPQPLP